MEGELYSIRGDNIIINPLFGKIKLVFYNVCTFHYTPTKFAGQAAIRMFQEISQELIVKEYNGVHDFAGWLTEDLEHGSVF